MIQMTCFFLECLLKKYKSIQDDSFENSMEIIFVYSAIWGFGSALYRDGVVDWYREFHKWWITEFKDVRFPSNGIIFDFYLNLSNMKFELWSQFKDEFEFDPEVPLHVSIIIFTLLSVDLIFCFAKKTNYTFTDIQILKIVINVTFQEEEI